VSTGRGFQGALPFAEQISRTAPMITANGGEIWRRPHELHRRKTMDASMVMKLHRVAEAHPDAWFWAYSTEGIYNKERWTDDTHAHEWLKFGYYTEDLQDLQAILDEISRWEGLELSNSSPSNIEINALGVSKAEAISEVCRMIGCDMSEAVAVGDSLNDLAAIRAAGLGVAMGNAQAAVKEAADVVTASNLEDGVAEVIRQYLLKA
jgi:HAD superfamily hydrolase (TIGR01484 family)